jgi:hypothetical protein
VLFESGLSPETGVTLAPFAVANSDALYLDVLMYPCTRFFSIRFTTTMAACAPLSVWIQMGSYRFTCFLLSSLSPTISARSLLVFRICLAQRQRQWPNSLELLRLRQIKFHIIAFPALFQCHQFFMRLGDGPVQLIAR